MFTRFFLVLLLAAALTACGGGEDFPVSEAVSKAAVAEESALQLEMAENEAQAAVAAGFREAYDGESYPTPVSAAASDATIASASSTAS